MADLNELEATESVKIIGASTSGLETTPVNSTTNGALYVNLRNNGGTEIGTNANPVQIGDAGGSITVDGTIAATQSGSWSVSVNNASGASAVNIQDGGNSITVDGTVAATQSGTWNINNISGTISLPTGAATETTLSAINTKTPALGQAVMASSSPVVIASNQSAIPVSQSGTWNITNISGTVSLPTGAATETTLAALNAKFNSLGQKTMANSAPVVLSSDQSAIPITDNAGSLTVDGTVTANQGTANTNVNAWFTRLTDGTDNSLITPNSDLQVIDFSNSGGSQGAITVGTSAVLANVSGSNLSNRKLLTVYNNSLISIYFGLANTVTTSNGTPIAASQFFTFSVGPSTNIYLIAGLAGQNVRITEMA